MDENILSLKEIISPNDILNKYSINDDDKLYITQSRDIIKNILCGGDDRLLVIIGPCSIHIMILQYNMHNILKNFKNYFQIYLL